MTEDKVNELIGAALTAFAKQWRNAAVEEYAAKTIDYLGRPKIHPRLLELKVDDPVMVRTSEIWSPRHFAKLEGQTLYAFIDGKTSFTCKCGTIENWRFIRLEDGTEIYTQAGV